MKQTKIKTEFLNIYGEPFLFQGKQEDDNVHVLQTGYIVSPDGKVVLIDDTDDHLTIFSEYISHYFNGENKKNYELYTAMLELADNDHIIYAGPKIQNVSAREWGNKVCSNICTLALPELEHITEDQFSFLNQLAESNKPLVSFSNNSELMYIHAEALTDGGFEGTTINSVLAYKKQKKL